MQLQGNELLALQALDNELGKLQSEKTALDRGERVERALAIRQSRLQQADQKLQSLEGDQRNAELELRGLEEKQHETSQRLYSGRVKNPRELQAMELEVMALERQRQRLDEAMLRRLEEIETARAAVATARAAAEEAEKALRVVRRRFEREAKRIDDSLTARQPERDALASQLVPEVLRRYEDIRRRNHNLGAVRVENGACSGCRMKIGAAVLRRLLAQDQYVYCESCSRYLFLPAEE